jgi:hypothetical protein
MDPDKLAAREKKFGKPLLASSAKKDIKDPDAMKRRAEKFGKPLAASSSGDDEARKKVGGGGVGDPSWLVGDPSWLVVEGLGIRPGCCDVTGWEG